METRKEVDIIKSVLGCDRNSYALLVETYKVPIFNLAYRMTGSYEDANDLSQETFVKAFENLERFDQEKKFFVWLYTIGLNIIRNHLKREQKIRSRAFPENDDLPLFDNHSNPEDALINDQRALQLNRCLHSLADPLKEAVVLRFYQDLSFEEIAEISGLSLSAAKMRAYRGLEKLRRLMEEDPVVPDKSP
ncbi:MAG TPA: RNA polymerase sigma factor [Syntrophales bacterium]|nr:RNA polymerase sigma factor [Syntrophales bacterium]HPQ42886.1 RNA polymerase sigma factor [Syntrophales bacterium]